jgi:hypothetical protein
MRYMPAAMLLALAAVSAAALPRIGVLTLEVHEEVDSATVVEKVESEYRQSGRFEVVSIAGMASGSLTPENMAYTLDEISSEKNLDVIVAVDVRPPVTDEYTSRRTDSLVTVREVSVEVSGRFYSSAGSLIGTVSEKAYDQREIPFSVDVQELALRAAGNLVESSLMDLFPVEIRFTASGGAEQELPAGTAAGLEKGMVMSVIGSSRRVPASEEEYALLGSRGLVQITSVGPSSARARLLAGDLVEGGPVTAVESGQPAAISISYQACPARVEPGDSLGSDEGTVVMNALRIEGRTTRWGLSFGGALNAGTADRLSSIGVEGMVGARIPLSPPGLALSLHGGAGMGFLIQETAVDTLASDASGFSFGGMASAGMELLLTGHLGLEAGAIGRLYTTIDGWNVQQYNGVNRDAEDSELYYTEYREAPVSFRAGLWYLIY